jgi:pyrroloquinoline quinone biosynthesis protein B
MGRLSAFMRLIAFILGAAAGGGFPQWNCNCDVCRLAWAGDPRVKPRTQASIALTTAPNGSSPPLYPPPSATLPSPASGEGEGPFVLINASPDLRQQIIATPALQPRGLRMSPIAAVVLTGGEIDQTAGLLTLRERGAFELYGTAGTLSTLAANSMFGVLATDVVPRKAVHPGSPFGLPGGIEAELFFVPGKAPLYLEGADPELEAETDANVGIELRANGARLVFIPGAAKLTPAIASRLAEADVVLFDGTLFSDDEMIAAGAGVKTGRRMGHMPVGGPDGTLKALSGLAKRRILIHINNTNPILIEDSPQRRTVEAAGFEVAEDGMRIEL